MFPLNFYSCNSDHVKFVLVIPDVLCADVRPVCPHTPFMQPERLREQYRNLPTHYYIIFTCILYGSHAILNNQPLPFHPLYHTQFSLANTSHYPSFFPPPPPAKSWEGRRSPGDPGDAHHSAVASWPCKHESDLSRRSIPRPPKTGHLPHTHTRYHITPHMHHITHTTATILQHCTIQPQPPDHATEFILAQWAIIVRLNTQHTNTPQFQTSHNTMLPHVFERTRCHHNTSHRHNVTSSIKTHHKTILLVWCYLALG